MNYQLKSLSPFIIRRRDQTGRVEDFGQRHVFNRLGIASRGKITKVPTAPEAGREGCFLPEEK